MIKSVKVGNELRIERQPIKHRPTNQELANLIKPYDKYYGVLPKNFSVSPYLEGIDVVIADDRMIDRSGRNIRNQFPEIGIERYKDSILIGKIARVSKGTRPSYTDGLAKRLTMSEFEATLDSRKNLSYGLIICDCLKYHGANIQHHSTQQRLNKRDRIIYYFHVTPTFIKIEDNNLKRPIKWAREREFRAILIRDMDAPYNPVGSNGWMKYNLYKEMWFEINDIGTSGYTPTIIRFNMNGIGRSVMVDTDRVARKLLNTTEVLVGFTSGVRDMSASIKCLDVR